MISGGNYTLNRLEQKINNLDNKLERIMLCLGIEDLQTDKRRVWLTVKEVAEYIGYNPNTIYKKIRHGQIKSRKWGNSVRVHISAIQPYVNKKRKK